MRARVTLLGRGKFSAVVTNDLRRAGWGLLHEYRTDCNVGGVTVQLGGEGGVEGPQDWWRGQGGPELIKGSLMRGCPDEGNVLLQ
eukprot:508037-Hanusia_phi.AAC.2